MTTPGGGHVLVIGTTTCYATNLSDTNDLVQIKVGLTSSDTGSPSNLNYLYFDYDMGGYSNDRKSVTSVDSFNVYSADTYTFYLRAAQHQSSLDNGVCYRHSLGAVFVPD